MTGLQRWRAADLPALVDRINKYSIGLDDYFDRLAELNGTQNSYPPYNLCLLYTSPSPRDVEESRMPSSA